MTVSGDGIDVDAGAIRRSGQRVHTTGTAVSGLTSDHVKAVSSAGLTWGDDDISALIGGSYQAVHDQAVQSLEAAAAALRDYGEGLQLMAGSHEDAELASQTAIQAITRPPDTR